MRRAALSLVLAAVAVGAFSGPAAAKMAELQAGVLSLCGPETCAPLEDGGTVAWLAELMVADDPAPGIIPARGSYYELRYTDLADSDTRPLGWVVPQAAAIRTYRFVGSGSHSDWYPLADAARDGMALTVRGIEPFAPPELSRVTVDGAVVGDVTPYLGLLGDLPETFRPAAGGDRVDIELTPEGVTPWTVSPAIRLAYAPAERAVRVAPRWYEVPAGLADRIELDAGLRPPSDGSSPWGSIAAAIAAGALALAAASGVVRWRRRSPGPATPRAG